MDSTSIMRVKERRVRKVTISSAKSVEKAISAYTNGRHCDA